MRLLSKHMTNHMNKKNCHTLFMNLNVQIPTAKIGKHVNIITF